ncbi:hypothetical protein Drorol1_Dr00019626 [Drosera rotundifolia]
MRSMRVSGAYSSVFSVWSFVSITLITTSAAVDTISMDKPLKDGENLTSAGGRFGLGFFSPGSNGKRYVGIWYDTIPAFTVVWVANREAPLYDTSGYLTVSNHPARLLLINGTGGVIWSTNSAGTSNNPVAQLLDSGNLVVRDQDDDNSSDFMWQSFDYPTDIQLPGMKLGWDLGSGLNRYVTSWKSSNDPSLGSYTYGFDLRGYPEPVLMKGDVEQYRNGPWTGVGFNGNPNLKPNPVFTYQYVFNDQEVYYVFELINSSVLSHRIINQYGTMQRLIWSNQVQGWLVYLTEQSDSCDNYGACGPFGSCNIADTPECSCLKGYEPKNLNNWNEDVWSDGCVRKASNSVKGDGFYTYTNTKLPDTSYAWYNMNMTLDQCRTMCSLNSSCLAYANMDVSNGGSGCFIWSDVLIDIEIFDQGGQDLHLRVPSSELGKGNQKVWTAVACSILPIAVLILCTTLYIRKRRRLANEAPLRRILYLHFDYGFPLAGRKRAKQGEADLPLFRFKAIAKATNNFSEESKLGEGGFGPVYKGVLKGGQEIAVKRLSKDSRQGLDEFKNEVVCIARLQHRNLVRLLGCCIHAEERMLIYEYLPNKSLDYFIFDEKRSMLLDWPRRMLIINGIARGLLYLHEDSRLRIIHRDLKASNVLLDADLYPKISDFGMARSFDGNNSQAKTLRVVGTYGYMSPEYAIDGQFSVKSDIFSFGVLLLEIVTGKRNRGFNHPAHCHNLLGHAWSYYLEGGGLELVDPAVGSSCNAYQVLRLIHIGLLCVQQCPDDRPGMSTVIVMLDSDCELPEPKVPGFFIGRNISREYSPESMCTNTYSATLVCGR